MEVEVGEYDPEGVKLRYDMFIDDGDIAHFINPYRDSVHLYTGSTGDFMKRYSQLSVCTRDG